jgi:hypothetical protein
MDSEAGLGAEVKQYHASLGFYRSQFKAELTLLLGSVFLVIEKRGANGKPSGWPVSQIRLAHANEH